MITSRINNLSIKIKANNNFLLLVIFFVSIFTILIKLLFDIDKTEELISFIIISFLFFIGAYFIIKESVKVPSKKIIFLSFESLFVFLGVVITFEFAKVNYITAVIASAFVGLFASLFIRKYATPIYCGSFSGMSSAIIFNRYEIILVALLCAIIYAFFITILDGFGGRLGTIAFFSSSITSLIFGKTTLMESVSINSFLLILVSIAGILIPLVIQRVLKQTSVFASAFPSLFLAFIISIIAPEQSVYSAVFFTASFVGMSSQALISNYYKSLIIGVIVAFIFLTFFNHYNGFGGKMGLMAFISLVIYIGLSKMLIQSKIYIKQIHKK